MIFLTNIIIILFKLLLNLLQYLLFAVDICLQQQILNKKYGKQDIESKIKDEYKGYENTGVCRIHWTFQQKMNHLEVAHVGGRIGHVLPVLTATIVPTHISWDMVVHCLGADHLHPG